MVTYTETVSDACVLFGELLVWHPPEEELVGNDAGAPHVDPVPVPSQEEWNRSLAGLGSPNSTANLSGSILGGGGGIQP